MRHIEGAAQQWETCRGVARKLESLGYDSLWLYDHFHTVPKVEIEPTFECWTTMAALAEELDLGFVPFLLEGVAGDPALNLADGIHPNARGHQQMAELVLPEIRATLDRLD